MPTVLAKLRRNLADLGPGLTLLKALSLLLARLSGGRVQLRVYAFVAQPLGRAAAALAAGGSTVVECIPAADPRRALAPRPATVLQARTAAGAQCRMAFVKGHFAGMHWVSLGSHLEDEVRCTYVMDEPARSVWDFDVHVEPAFRGTRVFARLWQAVDAALGSAGVRWSFSRIDALNTGSLASHAKLGARRVGRAGFLTVGRWQLSASTLAPHWHLTRPGAPGPVYRFSPPAD